MKRIELEWHKKETQGAVMIDKFDEMERRVMSWAKENLPATDANILARCVAVSPEMRIVMIVAFNAGLAQGDKLRKSVNEYLEVIEEIEEHCAGEADR